jgi:hypothetical protein
MERDYYNRRIGRDGGPPRLTLAEAARQIDSAYRTIDEAGYLQRSFGYTCVDAGEVPGRHGIDLRMKFYLRTSIKIERSVSEAIVNADEVTLFTIIEFIHDHIAKPLEGEGYYHPWNNCGLHLDHRRDKFDETSGRAEWRTEVNETLGFYDDGYRLSESGEIVRVAADGTDSLIRAIAPPGAEPTDAAKLANAVHTFQLGRSTREHRKQAVRELVDILEFHRDAVRTYLSKDEGDLFNIANNFALRHHNTRQRDDYDDAWLNWLFYVYLATAHLILARVSGTEAFAQPPPPPEPAVTPDDDIPF